MKHVAGIACLLLAVAASSSGGQPFASPGPKSAEGVEALLEVDRAFDADTAAKGAAGWVVHFEENGSMLPPSGPPIVGKEAIGQTMAEAFARPDYSLRWAPTRGEVLIPNLVGYTVGSSTRKYRNREGQLMLQRGTYVTVWRKQADGSWKVVFDTGTSDGPPQAIENAREEDERERLLAIGKRIFVERCGRCHDERGDKPLPEGLPLAERKLSPEVIARASGGRLRSYSEEERRAVALYIESFLKK